VEATRYDETKVELQSSAQPIPRDRRYRLLLAFTHPVQYTSPVIREFARHPNLDINVAYCSLQGAEPGVDPGFGVEVAWDVPLLDGYPWANVRNWSPFPGLNRFFGLINPGLWAMIRRGNYDAVVGYTGYANASFWILLTASKIHRVPILFGTDATSLKPRDGKRWKMAIKKHLLPAIFRLADAVIIPSEAGRQFILSLGIPETRVFLTPFAVDNTWWQRRANEVDRQAMRNGWNIPENSVVALFCAKLQPWKRPHDAIRAFAKANVQGGFLVFAGEGPLRGDLEAEARSLGIAERVRFLGFVNQTNLPAVYRSVELLVLPSEYDPCPVVVCEAMLCGCPVVLSDEIRGRFDLVKHNETGFIFPCGNVEALAKILSNALADRVKLSGMSQAAADRMTNWTPRENAEGVARAVARACNDRGQ
jgi:glycosyltransferase involved in cell wall biosynthesis